MKPAPGCLLLLSVLAANLLWLAAVVAIVTLVVKAVW